MSALASILIGVAAKVGAPVVKGILEQYVGGAVSEIGGTIIDTIAGKAGVPPEQLPDLPAKQIEAAVAAAEAEAPDLVIAWAKQQELSNQLQLAEMAKEPFWAWAWRPAWMWLLAFIWSYALIARPLLNAILGASIESVDLTVLMTLTGFFMSLYMGGHTVKSWLETRATK